MSTKERQLPQSPANPQLPQSHTSCLQGRLLSSPSKRLYWAHSVDGLVQAASRRQDEMAAKTKRMLERRLTILSDTEEGFLAPPEKINIRFKFCSAFSILFIVLIITLYGGGDSERCFSDLEQYLRSQFPTSPQNNSICSATGQTHFDANNFNTCREINAFADNHFVPDCRLLVLLQRSRVAAMFEKAVQDETLKSPVSTSPVSIPLTSPVSIPLTSPVSIPLTSPVSIPLTSPVSIPLTSPVSIPLTSPVSIPAVPLKKEQQILSAFRYAHKTVGGQTYNFTGGIPDTAKMNTINSFMYSEEDKTNNNSASVCQSRVPISLGFFASLFGIFWLTGILADEAKMGLFQF